MRIGTAANARPPIGRVGPDAARAEARGYATALYADHLMGWFPDSVWTPAHTPAAELRRSAHDYLDPACTVMAGAAATERITLGVGVTDVLRANPAVIARTALTLDHATEGRFVLGLGAGEAENLVPYGITMDAAVSRLEEGLGIIRTLWAAEGPVSLDTAHWPLRDAVLGLAPHVPDRPPPIWLAARGPRMRRLAAEHADGWLPMFLDAAEYASSLADIRRRRQVAGRTGPFEAALYAFVAIAESRERCLAMFDSPVFKCLGLLLPASSYAAHGLEHPLGGDRYGLLDFVPTSWDGPAAAELLAGVPPEIVGEAILHGSPDDIAVDLAAYADAGCDQAILANVSFLTDPGLVRPSSTALDTLVTTAAAL
jgi:phthiodiolone/phenolphthiodiolone dimycocerosates ketoreductase